jgi:hypothetical protein
MAVALDYFPPMHRFITVQGRDVPIFYDGVKDEHVDKALDYGPFQDWVACMDSESEFLLSKIEVQGVDMFGPRVGFLKFKADVKDKGGGFVPGIVFMRGGAVTILVILECEGRGVFYHHTSTSCCDGELFFSRVTRWDVGRERELQWGCGL